MKTKQLVINASFSHTRIALLENNRAAEIFYEFASEGAAVGSIYLGVVTRVLPGMNAAFVDIGCEKAAFLFGGDVSDGALPLRLLEDDDENLARMVSPRRPINQLLHEGQQILVQVAKASLGSKGPRITMHITLPGRYLVYMPYIAHVGVSRRIENEEERRRLREVVSGFMPGEGGLIVRTAAYGVSREFLARDFAYLEAYARELKRSLSSCKAPSLVYRDLNLMQKTLRDLYSDEISAVVVDDHHAFLRLERFCREVIPEAGERLHLYEATQPIFDAYHIEPEIHRALNKRINLPSGGYLVIEQTEALTTFDVNTGRFVGKVNAQQTIFTTNREAIAKIVEQLRLRNIGGIIVIDFIDMEDHDSRELLYLALQEELKKDRARTQVLRFSEFGLVQITRKRTSESLERILMTPCSHCQGKGLIKKDFVG